MNIPTAKPEDFQKATHRLHRGGKAERINELFAYTLANIKVVDSIKKDPTSENIERGIAPTGVKPASNLIDYDYISTHVPTHEWGHSCGINHRGDGINPGLPSEGWLMNEFPSSPKK